MSLRKSSVVLAVLLVSSVAFADHVIVRGVVESYEPNKVIVVKSVDQGVVTYELTPEITVPARIQPGAQVILRTDPQGIAAASRGMAQRPDVTDKLRLLDLPALLVCGEHDPISTVAEMRQIAAQMPQATFVEIPAAGHMAPLERPEPVNAAIREFLG